MFSNDFQPIRPPRKRRSQSRGPNEQMEFCGQFPNRMKRNFSTEVLNNSNSREVNAFHEFKESFPPKRCSNLEINRTLSQNGSPFVPLFGPNFHPLMGQMWKPLRHSQTQVARGEREKREEPKKKTEKTFEDHFNQYKGSRQQLKEEKKEPKPGIDSIHRKSVFNTLERIAKSSERSGLSSRKNSLPTEVKAFKAFNAEEALPVRRAPERGRAGEWTLLVVVILVNLVLVFLALILMIY